MTPTLQGAAAWFSGGAGVGAGIYLFRWLFDWIGLRVDRREAVLADGHARIDKATQDLIGHLQARLETMNARITDLERELDDCRKRDAEKDARIARLEAQALGFGDARQHAQLIVSQERAERKQ